ncbi:transcriptional regulator, MucR family [Methylorubrum extorquens DSM 13060]|uniref:Transcriptional regulator, MucR family n=2 Tax=Methylorubrum extorquens TaxID=408 RepID=H1KCM6_METEX|nr:transcriptional regulator, MucR family [Methylorubrum extorquens DSM 13060]
MNALEKQMNGQISLAARIVRAYVSNNSIPSGELPGLIVSVNATLSGIASGKEVSEPEEDKAKPTPAQVRKSVGPEGIVSFIDGRIYKTLKRHLTTNRLTPDQYRERFGLPHDYPMVCASYSAKRSDLAKQNGLGSRGIRKDRSAAPAPARPQRAARKAA